MANENGSAVSGDTQQGANPVQDVAERGDADFNRLINETQPTGNAGGAKRATPGTLPTKDVSKDPEGEKAAEVVVAKPAETAADRSALIADVVKATLAGSRPAEQRPAPQKISDEDFNKKFGVMNVTDAHIQQLLDADPKKAAAALNTMFQGLNRQSLLMAQELFESRMTEMQAKFTPHVESWTRYQREQNEAKVEQQFYTAFPALVDEKDLVAEIRDAMVLRVQSGQLKFSSQTEANKAVADAAMKIVSRMQKPQGDAAGDTTRGQTASTAKPNSGGRTMAAASSAGRAGTGKTAELSVAEQIFGADAR